MATVRPAKFPSVTHDSIQRQERVRPQKAAKSPAISQVKKSGFEAKGHGSSKAVNEIGPKREQKLEQAIEVLRAKTVQLYHRDSTKVEQHAELGQIIDVTI